MVATKITMSPRNQGDKVIVSEQINSPITPFTVNSDSYVDAFYIPSYDMKRIVFQITNTHATNPITYRIVGTLDLNKDGNGVPQLPVVDSTWGIISRPQEKTLAALSTNFENTKDVVYAWIVIQIKRGTAGSDSSAGIFAKSIGND